MVPEQKNLKSAWQERMSALRNLPPVLKIVWRSGPAVVTSGMLFRVLAAIQPLAILYVSKLIIDGIFNVVTKHQPIPTRLWWLVGAEFGLALVGNIFTRIVDFTDQLLADKYTRHVSIEVMRHAAELDVLAYEDPEFYDRLERARVQATDRLAMIQMLGRLQQQVITTITLSIGIVYYSPWLLLLLIAGVLPAFVGESHFAFLGYAKNFRQNRYAAPDGLLPPGRRQQRGGEGAETLRIEQVLDGPVRHPRRSRLCRERRTLQAQADSGRASVDYRNARLLLGLRVGDLADGHRRLQHRYPYPAGRSDSAGQLKHSADFLDTVWRRRPGVVFNRFAGLF